MADEDKQIEIKKRARRRLVGAAALALFAVIVLPMVMDSEPRPVEHDIQVRIPPQSGANAAGQAIRENHPSPPPEAAVPPPEPAAAAVSPAEAAPQPAAVAPPAAKAEAPPPAPSPVEAPATAGGSGDGARAAAILAGAATGGQVGAQFVVQLGAYRDRANATSLQTRLKSDGFASYTEQAGDKTRVRVGPYSDRAAAESALTRLKRLGLGGSVMSAN